MIVITGALGHVGSKLILDLESNDIVMIDNMNTQAYPSLFYLPKKNYKFIKGDIFNLDLASIFKGAEVVIHLAAIADPENSHEQRELVNKVNVEGTRIVAEACIKAKVPMIFASTTSVYGVQEEEVDETCTHLQPQTPYADSKIAAERMLKTMKGLKYIICRFGTVFGPSRGMRFHTAVNRFCFQAAIGQPITVWNTALNQNRPYLDLEDMVRAIQFIIDNKVYTNEIYNLVTINTTVGRIIDIIKKTIPDLSINFVDSPIMSQLSYTISNKKFTNLGFDFKGNIDKGVTETLELLR